jgi:GTP-binding protein
MAAEDLSFAAISAATGEGVQKMLYQLKQMLDEVPAAAEPAEEVVVIRPEADPDAFTISREEDGWRVHGKNIERIAAMTYWEFEPTVLRFQQILEKMGITEALGEAGIREGDTVYIGDNTLEWSD